MINGYALLGMASADERLTDVVDTEQLLRIIQSIPSPKIEPFKRWLAQVGRERIKKTIEPEQAITSQNAAQLNAVVVDVIESTAGSEDGEDNT